MKFSIFGLGKSIASALQVGANFAAVCGLIAAVYAFIHPASVADYGAEVLKLMQQAGADVAAIKESSAETAENTSETADNTAKLAAAIPNWLTYDMGQLGMGLNGFLYSNNSPAKIDYSAKYFIDGNLLGEFNRFAMPNEVAPIDIPKETLEGLTFSEFRLCLTGTSALMPDTVFYEMRVFRAPQPDDQLGEMVAADIQFEPFADCE